MKHFEFASEQELKEELSKGLVPENSTKQWALKNTKAWLNAKNGTCPENPVPEDFLNFSGPDVLSNYLSRFIVETRKSNGEHYPPSTLHQLLCGILR